MSYRFPSIPSDLAKAVLGSEFTVSVMVVSKHGFDDADIANVGSSVASALAPLYHMSFLIVF